MGNLLPAGFEAAEAFVTDWVHGDASARMHKRQSSSIEELKAFYDVMLPLGEAALGHLRQFPLGEVPEDAERLLKLMLMLAEVAPAVEWYGDPMITDGFPVDRIRYLRQIPDSAAQRGELA